MSSLTNHSHRRTQCHQIKSWKTSRLYCFSNPLKLALFYLLEWSPDVIDFWESCPLLPLDQTLAIAESCELPHPTNPGTGQPAVMTTDFLQSIRNGDRTLYVPASVKSLAQLQNPRSLGELEIERRYWAARKTSLTLVTEDDLHPSLIKNIAWIHPYRDSNDFTDLDQLPLSLLASILINALKEGTKSLLSITRHYDRYMEFPRGTSLAVIRHLLANRLIRINMLKPIKLDEPLTLEYSNAAKENDSQEDQNEHSSTTTLRQIS
jgi:TnsA endonuclease C terminal/TnsA endonuclease N terminal